MLYFKAYTRTDALVSQNIIAPFTVHSTVINKKILSDYLFLSSKKNVL